MFAKTGADRDEERMRNLKCYQEYYKKEQKEISWKNGKPCKPEISWKKDKPSKPAYVWEENSTSNNTKAFWRSYEILSVQPWPIMAIGWEIEFR